MKIYKKRQKQNTTWGYWGDYGEIDIGFSYGEATKDTPGDKLHYHKTGTVYILPLEGKGMIEVNGKQIEMEKEVLIQIDPGERYKHTQVTESPLRWITVCSIKTPEDKVIIDES